MFFIKNKTLKTLKLISLISITMLLMSCKTLQQRVAEEDDANINDIKNLQVSMIQQQVDVNKTLLNNNDETLIKDTIDRINSKLKDPDSAKFKNIKVFKYNDGKVVCGMVNAKNSMGGYTGYKHFLGNQILSSNDLSTIKRNRPVKFYDRALEAYYSGYNLACN